MTNREIVIQAGELGAAITTLLIVNDRVAASALITTGVPEDVDPVMFLTMVALTCAELAGYTHRTWADSVGADRETSWQTLLTHAAAWREGQH